MAYRDNQLHANCVRRAILSNRIIINHCAIVIFIGITSTRNNKYKMFAVITLEKSFDVFTIPVEWVKGFDLLNAVNEGINCSESLVVFLSNDEKTTPNFSTPISLFYNFIDSGCFSARLNKFFSKYCVGEQIQFSIGSILVIIHAKHITSFHSHISSNSNTSRSRSIRTKETTNSPNRI